MTAAPESTIPAPARLALAPGRAGSRRHPKPLGVDPFDPDTVIGLSTSDARHHLHVLGPTGTGKSTLLLNLVQAEVRAGRGVTVLDPWGDLVRNLLDRLPATCADRLVLIDPDERDAPAALNLFDTTPDPEQVTDTLVGVMAKVWATYWGPRTDDLARHAVLTLAHTPGATLADLPLLLADPGARHRAIGRARDRLGPVEAFRVAQFWQAFDALPPGQAAVQAGPLLSKLRAVLSRRFAAGLFGTAASTLRLADVLDGGVLLARLPKGTLGEDTVRLVGSLLLAALLQAGAARAGLPEHRRLDATVVIDECHNFTHLPIGLDTALAEARGLRLSLVLAHQHLGQLTGPAAAALDANARNKVYFSLSPDDARDQVRHVAPYFEAGDLSRRDAYGIVTRLVIDGRDSEPFSLATRPAPPAVPGRADQLRQAARARGLPAAVRQAHAEGRLLGPARTTRPATPPALPPAARPDPTGTNPTDPTPPTGSTP